MWKFTYLRDTTFGIGFCTYSVVVESYRSRQCWTVSRLKTEFSSYLLFGNLFVPSLRILIFLLYAYLWALVHFAFYRPKALDHFWVFSERYFEKYPIHEQVFEMILNCVDSIMLSPFQLLSCFELFLGD